MKRYLVILFICVCASACCIIDDDLSDCGVDMLLNYQLQLHTEMSVQLQTELLSEAEQPVRKALEQWLSPIFTDKAKDIDLRFYSAQEDVIKHEIKEEINDNRTSYTIYLPKESYMHLALANVADNRQVQLFGGEHSSTMELRLTESEDVGSAATGVFTARLPMDVNDSSTHFDVHLYMITAAVALVVDPSECPDLVSLNGRVLGTANRFSVRDSVFSYTGSHAIQMDDIFKNGTGARAEKAAAEPIQRLCLAAVGLPTQDDKSWTVKATATLSDNRHTTTTLTVDESLKAGTLRIIKCKLNKKGELQPSANSEVGATVELDWKEGGDHEIDI